MKLGKYISLLLFAIWIGMTSNAAVAFNDEEITDYESNIDIYLNILVRDRNHYNVFTDLIKNRNIAIRDKDIEDYSHNAQFRDNDCNETIRKFLLNRDHFWYLQNILGYDRVVIYSGSAECAEGFHTTIWFEKRKENDFFTESVLNFDGKILLVKTNSDQNNSIEFINYQPGCCGGKAFISFYRVNRTELNSVYQTKGYLNHKDKFVDFLPFDNIELFARDLPKNAQIFDGVKTSQTHNPDMFIQPDKSIRSATGLYDKPAFPQSDDEEFKSWWDQSIITDKSDYKIYFTQIDHDGYRWHLVETLNLRYDKTYHTQSRYFGWIVTK